MKIPTSVLETSFSEVLATVKSVPTATAVSVVPAITPTISTPPSPRGLNIKPQHIIIGIAAITVAYLIYLWLQKKNEESRRNSHEFHRV
jgi:hypothetical protein